MKKNVNQAIISLLLSGFILSSAGCYGSFALTKKVYNWNGKVGDKWMKEVVFLGLNIIPVYSIASFADVVILNSVEFWTGKNPATATNFLESADHQSRVEFDREHNLVQFTETFPGQAPKVYRITHENGNGVVRDENNVVIVRCLPTDDGGLKLVNAEGKTLSAYSKTEVESTLNME